MWIIWVNFYWCLTSLFQTSSKCPQHLQRTKVACCDTNITQALAEACSLLQGVDSVPTQGSAASVSPSLPVAENPFEAEHQGALDYVAVVRVGSCEI